MWQAHTLFTESSTAKPRHGASSPGHGPETQLQTGHREAHWYGLHEKLKEEFACSNSLQIHLQFEF